MSLILFHNIILTFQEHLFNPIQPPGYNTDVLKPVGCSSNFKRFYSFISN